MTIQFGFEAHVERGCSIARPSGEIDLSNAAELEARLTALIETGDVVVDLSGVTFLDSTGLGAMIVAYRRGQELGHVISLAAAHGPVRNVLEITRLDIALVHHDDVDEAVDAMVSARAAGESR